MPDPLARYRAMRDFGSTTEPAGAPGQPEEERARFVVQEHHATRLHWDLRLEHEGVLASWAIPNGIPETPDENRKAVHTEDHPLEYLDFHGVIPKGSYGAGSMTIWDRGTYELHKWRDAEVMVTFHGERLRGRYVLFRAGSDEKDWMIHRMDPAEDPDREPFPSAIAPMGARAGEPPDRARYEFRWPGLRAIAYSQPGRLRFETAPGREVELGGLSRLNRALSSHHAVLDGVVVAFDAGGRPDPERLDRRTKKTPITYVIFDLLWLDGHSLMPRPYDERRAALLELELQGETWRTPPHHAAGEAMLAAAKANGLPGVIAKAADGAYRPGRRDWVAAGAPAAEPRTPDWYPRIEPAIAVPDAGAARLVRRLVEGLGLRAWVARATDGFVVAVPLEEPGRFADTLVALLAREGIETGAIPVVPYAGGVEPLDWEELDDPPDPRDGLARRGDPWAGALLARQSVG